MITVALIDGRVIFLILWKIFAPSTEAASYISASTPTIAAIYITEMYPHHYQELKQAMITGQIPGIS